MPTQSVPLPQLGRPTSGSAVAGTPPSNHVPWFVPRGYADAVARRVSRHRQLVLLMLCGLLAAGSGFAVAGFQSPAPPPRVDHDGDPLPADALARLGTMRFRSSSDLYQVAFSPNGKQIAAAGTSQGVEVFDRVTGRRVLSGGEALNTLTLAFSPDGKLLAVPGPFRNKHWTVRVLSLKTGNEEQRFEFHENMITCLAFSPDGRQLASGSSGHGVNVVDVATGKLVRRVGRDKGSFWRLAFSPDGQTLATANRNGTIYLWDPANEQAKQRLEQTVPNGFWFPALTFSADSQTLTTGAALGARVWDARTGRWLRGLAHTFGPAQALALSPDGKTLALGNAEGEVATWAVATDKQQQRWQAAAGPIYALAFAPDGKTLASGAGSSSLIRLWDPASGRGLNPCTDHRGDITKLIFGKDGQTLLSADSDGRVCRWDVRTFTQQGRFDVPGHGLARFAVSSDLKTVAVEGDDDTTISLFAASNGRRLRTMIGTPAAPAFRRQLALSPDGHLLVSGAFIIPLVVRNTVTGKESHRLGDVRLLLAAVFSPNGRLLATAEGRSKDGGRPAVHLWNVASGKELRLFGKGGAAGAVAFSSDGRLLAAGGNESQGITVWETETGKQVGHFPSHAGYLYAVAFSPDTRLLTVGDSDVHVWEIASGSEARKFVGHRNGITALAFAPKGRMLASAGSDPILLWDMTGRTAKRGKRVHDASSLNACWDDLTQANAGGALDAVYALVDAPDLVVPFLDKNLQPAQAFDARRFAQLVDDLDSPRFRIRKRASAELENTSQYIEPAVRARLKGKLTPEARRRLEQVLKSIQRGPHWLRQVRALQVLEDIGTPAARAILKRLATGPAEAPLTQEARQTLARCQPVPGKGTP